MTSQAGGYPNRWHFLGGPQEKLVIATLCLVSHYNRSTPLLILDFLYEGLAQLPSPTRIGEVHSDCAASANKKDGRVRHAIP